MSGSRRNGGHSDRGSSSSSSSGRGSSRSGGGGAGAGGVQVLNFGIAHPVHHLKNSAEQQVDCF